MLQFLESIILGIVEGITEWLPISSTGHMLLLYDLFGIDPSTPFWEMYLVVIQFGAILAVIVTYFKRLWPFHRVDERKTGIYRVISKPKLIMWLKIVVSCIPAAIVGAFFDDWLEERLYKTPVIAFMLILVGVLFILVENRNRGQRARVRKISQISWTEAFLIGLFQLVAAVFPGTSRSGATILGGVFLGLSRKCAAEYTFFLGVPVMFGASLLKLVKFGGFSGSEIMVLLVGMMVAFLVSMVAIRFLMKYIQTHDFKIFGWYRIALGVIVFVWYFARLLAA